MKIIKQYSNIKYDPNKNIYSVSKIGNNFITKGPLNVGLQITRFCNFRCIYCSESAKYTNRLNIIDDPTLNNINIMVKNLKNAGVFRINLTGGEPLLRKDLVDIVNLIYDNGIFVGICSNLSLLSEKLAKSIRDKILYFEVSLDGLPCKQKENGRIWNGSFLDRLAILRNNNIPIRIASVLNFINYDVAMNNINYIINIGKKFDVLSIKFMGIGDKGRGLALSKRNNSNKIIPLIYNHIKKLKDNDSFLRIDMIFSKVCDYHEGKFVLIHPDGKMVGTPFFKNESKNYIIGNILTESIVNIWSTYPFINNHIRRYIGESQIIF